MTQEDLILLRNLVEDSIITNIAKRQFYKEVKKEDPPEPGISLTLIGTWIRGDSPAGRLITVDEIIHMEAITMYNVFITIYIIL